MPRSLREILENADALARQFEDYTPGEEEFAYAEALAAVHRAVLARAEAEGDLAEAVAAARRAGAPWTSIGTTLGTSGEAARQRYGHYGDHRLVRWAG